MHALDLIRLAPLMERTTGSPDVVVAIVDGPVALDHPDLAGARIRALPGAVAARCTLANSVACQHGTFVAGMLAARRGSPAPAICPACTLLVDPIFPNSKQQTPSLPLASPGGLADAIDASVAAGASIINLSLGLDSLSMSGQARLTDALDGACRSGVLVVAAAGNGGVVGSSAITRHPWVISVAACDEAGRPATISNLGATIARQGLSAPGDAITSLGTSEQPRTFGGTSVAAPFVTGAAALLWSEFPHAPAALIRHALVQTGGQRRRSVVPPLLDAWSAFLSLKAMYVQVRTV